MVSTCVQTFKRTLTAIHEYAFECVRIENVSAFNIGIKRVSTHNVLDSYYIYDSCLAYGINGIVCECMYVVDVTFDDS